MNTKMLILIVLIAIHIFMTPPAHAFQGTYADCQDQPTPFGPKAAPWQCCVERHFEAVNNCRDQKGCKAGDPEGCPVCKDPLFEIDNCPERA